MGLREMDEKSSRTKLTNVEIMDISPALEAQSAVVAEKKTYDKISWVILSILLFLLFQYAPDLSNDARQRSSITFSGLREGSLSAGNLEILGEKFRADASVAESLFIEDPSSELLTKSLAEYTNHPHLAGNLALARYTRDKWLEAGVQDVEIVEYEVLLNYPTERSQLSLYDKRQKVWEATLREDVLPEDPGSKEAVPFFHGYSKNGSATGNLVYLNYGTPEDFDLVGAQVNLEGKIGIARYGGLFRGLKVELAQRHGLSAMLLYDDPSEDRNITVENGFEAYPKGPARNPSSVQRGSVQFLSVLPGDPSTPGYASIPGCKREDPYKSIPSIPSLPISGRDAEFLLKTLNGHGPVLPGFAGALPGVNYNIGGQTESALSISLDNSDSPSFPIDPDADVYSCGLRLPTDLQRDCQDSWSL